MRVSLIIKHSFCIFHHHFIMASSIICMIGDLQDVRYEVLGLVHQEMVYDRRSYLDATMESLQQKAPSGTTHIIKIQHIWHDGELVAMYGNAVRVLPLENEVQEEEEEEDREARRIRDEGGGGGSH
jgi:hypothetical protein